ncbi:hypothetical protein imdm_1892 [gamma proteobacterium IMCC2047]|nr:hypothetical protein imdm_1892 [gamma proteobacterium IMCC2047]
MGQQKKSQKVAKISDQFMTHLTSKVSIALRAGRANARRCFGR